MKCRCTRDCCRPDNSGWHRLYKKGDLGVFDKCPKHFAPYREPPKDSEAAKEDAERMAMIATATAGMVDLKKEEINVIYELELSPSQLKALSHANLSEMALNKIKAQG